MPTKPSPAVRPRWDTGGANRVTPSGGKIALGWEGGEAPSSSYFNWWQFETGEITAWVLDGSSAGAADAHIVETDASGFTSVRQLTALGPTGDNYGVAGQGSGIAPGVTGLGGNGNAGGSGDTLNGGFGVRGISGSGTGVAGVLGIGRSGGNHPGVHGVGAGTSAGVYGASTSTSGTGIEGQGGSVSGVGVHGIGGGSGAGVRGDGGAGGPGVWGVTPDTTAAYGVLGSTSSGSDADCAGVRGTGIGDAMGVFGRSVDGYGVVAEAGNAVRSSLRVVPQSADPSTAANGDIAYVDDGTVSDLRARVRAGWRSVMWRTLGQCHAHAYEGGPIDSNDSVLWADICEPDLVAPFDPRVAGDVLIRVTGEVLRDGSDSDIQLQIFDDTANVSVGTRGVILFQTGNEYERDISWEMIYTLPAPGPRQFTMRFRRSGGSDIVSIRNVMVTIDGVF